METGLEQRTFPSPFTQHQAIPAPLHCQPNIHFAFLRAPVSLSHSHDTVGWQTKEKRRVWCHDSRVGPRRDTSPPPSGGV